MPQAEWLQPPFSAALCRPPLVRFTVFPAVRSPLCLPPSSVSWLLPWRSRTPRRFGSAVPTTTLRASRATTPSSRSTGASPSSAFCA